MRDGQELARLSASSISPAQLRSWLTEQLTHVTNGGGEEEC
jgi:hypothetical protein